MVEIYDRKFGTVEEFYDHIQNRLDYLVSARPTAVNMADSRFKLLNLLTSWKQEENITVDDIKARYDIFHLKCSSSLSTVCIRIMWCHITGTVVC